MPFGLKMSEDVFQMQMDQATDHLSGIIEIHDNIGQYYRSHYVSAAWPKKSRRLKTQFSLIHTAISH